MSARFARLGLALLALAAVGGGPVHTVQAQDAASALRSGDYDAAILLLQRQAKKEPRAAAAHRLLVRTLAEVGRYADAEEEAKTFQAANPRSPELLTSLGEILATRGRNSEAESAFKKALAGGASDALTAEVDLAALRLARGERDEAMRGFHRLIDAYNQASSLSSEQLAAVARACWTLSCSRTPSRPSTNPSPPIPTTWTPASTSPPCSSRSTTAPTPPPRQRRRWTATLPIRERSWPWPACSMRTARRARWRCWSGA